MKISSILSALKNVSGYRNLHESDDGGKQIAAEKLSDFTNGYSDVLSNKIIGKYIYRAGEQNDASIIRSGSYPGMMHALAAAPTIYAYCMHINSKLRGAGHEKVNIRLVNGGNISVLGDKDKYTADIINYIISSSNNDRISLSPSDIYTYNKKFYNSKLFRKLMALYKSDKSTSVASAYSDENTLWYIILKYAEESRTNSTNPMLDKMIKDYRSNTKERSTLFVDTSVYADGSVVSGGANIYGKKHSIDPKQIESNRNRMASSIEYNINDKMLANYVINRSYNYIIDNMAHTTAARKFFKEFFTALNSKMSDITGAHSNNIVDYSKHIKSINKDIDNTDEGAISLGSAISLYIAIILQTLNGAAADSDLPDNIKAMLNDELDVKLYGNMIGWISSMYIGNNLEYSPSDNKANLSRSTISEYEQLLALRNSSTYKGNPITADSVIREYSIMYGSCTVYFDMTINDKEVRFSATAVDGSYDWKVTIESGSSVTVSSPDMSSIWTTDYRLLPDLTSRVGSIYKSLIDMANNQNISSISNGQGGMPSSSAPALAIGDGSVNNITSFIFSTASFMSPKPVLDWATFVWPTYSKSGISDDIAQGLAEIYKKEYYKGGKFVVVGSDSNKDKQIVEDLSAPAWKIAMNSQLDKIYEACNAYRSALRKFIKYNVADNTEEGADKMTIDDIYSYIREHAGDSKSDMGLPDETIDGTTPAGSVPKKIRDLYANSGYFMGINVKLLEEFHNKYYPGSSIYKSLESISRDKAYSNVQKVKDTVIADEACDLIRVKLGETVEKYKDNNFDSNTKEEVEAALKEVDNAIDYIPPGYEDKVQFIRSLKGSRCKDLVGELSDVRAELEEELNTRKAGG